MPRLGEIRYGREIGRKSTHKFLYTACLDCHKERWVKLEKGAPVQARCKSCSGRLIAKKRNLSGKDNPNWNGGEHMWQGYVLIYKPEHPRAWGGKYVKRARLVLEEQLGRYLLLGMDVHHKNEIKNDDRPENLEELTRGEHNRRRKKKLMLGTLSEDRI